MEDQGVKLSEAPGIKYSEINYFWLNIPSTACDETISMSSQKIIVQSYASLTHKDPAYLQTTYHDVCIQLKIYWTKKWNRYTV